MTDGATTHHAATQALVFADHLPALQVLLPLMGAPLCFLLRKEALASAFTVAISFACLAISVSLLGQTMDGQVLVYEFGGWPRPFGIEYRIYITNAFVLVVVSLVVGRGGRRARKIRNGVAQPRHIHIGVQHVIPYANHARYLACAHRSESLP